MSSQGTSSGETRQNKSSVSGQGCVNDGRDLHLTEVRVTSVQRVVSRGCTRLKEGQEYRRESVEDRHYYYYWENILYKVYSLGTGRQKYCYT